MKFKNVFVIVDHERALGELCAGGRELGERVTAFVFGNSDAGRKAITLGADEAIICTDTQYLPEEYAKSIAGTIQDKQADLVLLSASVRGRLLAGKVAAYLGSCVASGVASVSIADGVAITRMVYGGTALRTEILTAAIPVITLGVGVFSALEVDEGRVGAVTASTAMGENRIKRLKTQDKKEAAVNLATAHCIVDMGRGFAREEDLELGRKLAAVLGADVGCSRPVAESNGWMPRARYIGVTGVVIKPALCVVLGISGQVQHLVGINQSKTVVAINKDKDAAIFKHADLGVAGDMYQILPALIQRLT